VSLSFSAENSYDAGVYYVYLILCKDNTIYTGITTDVERRFAEHKAGTASKYTRARKAKKLLYSEKAKNRSAALRRELEIKSWTRKEKLTLITRLWKKN
jgi:putative endonuclease